MATQNGTIQGMLVVGHTGMGSDVHAKLVRLTRYAAIFEIYNTGVILRTSEIFENLRIISHERTIYSGRAVIQKIIDAGLTHICEAKLDEAGWRDLQFDTKHLQNGELRKEFQHFMADWQKSYRISPEFKIAVADLHSFLFDLKLWVEQIELGVRSQPAGNTLAAERAAIDEIQEPIVGTALRVLERFEVAASNLDPETRPAHMNYMKRQIHPLVLCAPFIHRTFFKPLGYAGDYEMVNMMVRDPYEGGSLFAKMANSIFLNTPPVQAHRDRLVYLTELLKIETLRATRKNKVARIFNMGCGPAKEIQDFLRHRSTDQRTDFTLVDFNDETLAYTSKTLSDIARKYDSPTEIRLIKKSVNQLIKEAFKLQSSSEKYDIVYCAGLFDYLSDPICKKLLNVFYDLVAPGGLLIATNVDDSNPSKGWMEFVLDWHLVYRNGSQFAHLRPDAASSDDLIVRSVGTGVNIFLEVRKPENVR